MKPASNGEHILQQQSGSAERANAFYDAQMLDHLNERMVRLIQRQEMIFVATADKQGESDCSFRAGLHINGKADLLDNQQLLQRDDIPGAVQETFQVEGGRHPERWVKISVEEAYIHCSKHVPRLVKVDKTIHWRSDDESCKGGDFFAARKFPEDAV